ncbi:hypothetical protein GCM10023258_39080 [Terrabacter aeriphilus]|uniref:Uncharacterized protein n=1 Tax=Terrabacter aeriphilus TaxID=515662 RepID=A0ABP9JM31_9MICO
MQVGPLVVEPGPQGVVAERVDDLLRLGEAQPGGLEALEHELGQRQRDEGLAAQLERRDRGPRAPRAVDLVEGGRELPGRLGRASRDVGCGALLAQGAGALEQIDGPAGLPSGAGHPLPHEAQARVSDLDRRGDDRTHVLVVGVGHDEVHRPMG